MTGNRQIREPEVARARRRVVDLAIAVVPEHIEDVDAWVLASAHDAVGAGCR